MHPSRREPLQRAVDDANGAIRAYVRSLPGYRVRTGGQRAEYGRLVDVYVAAVREREREGESVRAA